ncbi:CBS domain-containing protein [Antrihabitans stalactiti]|uniref:CBS domain-containing protein n=1 Tax=Antrihabitans stalactiti TaxID=2584121 RepID=A0A848K919_9NOCA|nr:CBS domain-containing protein [Antrihabitans stalactiti]NMN93784.1 CBS domain-containing protein [Antrihabitans stalactiti]
MTTMKWLPLHRTTRVRRPEKSASPRVEVTENRAPLCAADLMSCSIPLVKVGIQLDAAARVLANSGATTIAVVDEAGFLVNVITADSVARTQKAVSWALTDADHSVLPAELTSSVLNFALPPFCVGLRTPLPEILETMLQSGLRSIPVVYYGHPIGIVSWPECSRPSGLAGKPRVEFFGR